MEKLTSWVGLGSEVFFERARHAIRTKNEEILGQDRLTVEQQKRSIRLLHILRQTFAIMTRVLGSCRIMWKEQFLIAVGICCFEAVGLRVLSEISVSVSVFQSIIDQSDCESSHHPLGCEKD